MPTEVYAGPTKRFFVEMLTRDIELKDAILDLLDNCLDGVQRSIRNNTPRDPAQPYRGFHAKIWTRDNCFVIEDNCGGISKKIAVENAFRLGRVDSTRDADLPTVGMYGIGMKRAIFKMGRNAVVHSYDGTDSYEVKVTENWLREEENWKLALIETEKWSENFGTRIAISDLVPGVSASFDEQNSSFVDDLKKEIEQLYSLIIIKGFEIFVNDQIMEPKSFNVLLDPSSFDQDAIRPYVFSGRIQGVDVSVVVGFYRTPAKQAEIDTAERYPSSRSDTAGWNIICNDRLVLHADKSPVTGWGTRNIPRYHTQFISVTGSVTFTSSDSFKLPLKTTKRGVDTNSDLYMIVLDYMIEGLRHFIDFTNKWKGSERSVSSAFSSATLSAPADVTRAIPEDRWQQVKKVSHIGSARRYVPNLPLPPADRKTKRISFLRPADQIEEVAAHLLGSASAKPSEVGGECFDRALEAARTQ